MKYFVVIEKAEALHNAKVRGSIVGAGFSRSRAAPSGTSSTKWRSRARDRLKPAPTASQLSRCAKPVPDLPGCIAVGDTVEEVEESIRSDRFSAVDIQGSRSTSTMNRRPEI